MNGEFWDYLQVLVNTNKIIIDRPKGSAHYKYGGKLYPVNYGYLEGTLTIDMGGIDIWKGSKGDNKVVGVLCTVDLQKKDTELKILIDCLPEEIDSIIEFTNTGQMRAFFVTKE